MCDGGVWHNGGGSECLADPANAAAARCTAPKGGQHIAYCPFHGNKMSSGETRFQLARLRQVCTPTHQDSRDPDHRHNALTALKLLLSPPGQSMQSSCESIGNKENVVRELKDNSSFDECVKLVLEIADDREQHSRTILQAAGRTHERGIELEVKNIAASLYLPPNAPFDIP
jgi:hypothetical protein